MTPLWFSAGLDEVPTTDAWLDPILARRLTSMTYTKRRSEARLSRWVAKVAVARALGVDLTGEAALRQVVVLNAADGAPEAFIDDAPVPFNIAMTDRADWAVCAVGPSSILVGCDLELVETRSAGFVRSYLTEPEQVAVHDAPNWDLAANLVWSAKESALKVLRTGLRRDTRSVEVTVDGWEGDTWQELSIDSSDGVSFPGWWTRFGSFVLTLVTSARTSPPESFDDPPALAAATPSHRWMDSPRA